MAIQLYDLAGKDPDIMFSPFCWRVRMALLHKGLDFELIPWRFAEKETIAESGHSAVPVIKDGDKWIGDSWEIIKYLDTQYPDLPTLLSGSEGRAHAQLVLELCGSLVFPAVIPIAVYQAYKILDEASQPYFRESREAMFGTSLEQLNANPQAGKAGLVQALNPFDALLQTSNFIGGDQPTYADYALFGILKWADIVSSYRPIDDTSFVGRWFVRLENMYDGHAKNVPTVRNR